MRSFLNRPLFSRLLSASLVATLTLTAGATGARAQTAAPPPAPTTSATQPAVDGRTALPTTPVSTAPYGRYLIQPSDTVAISYRYSPEYDFTGPVQPDGFIIPPLLGELMVMGLTIDEVRDRVLERARVRLRDPEVFVVLKDFEKPSFSVGGQVEKPGRFELRGRIGVLEAIAIAGGFKTSAKHSQVVLFRRYDAEQVVSRVLDVKKMERHASDLQNIELQAGDFLMVPKSRMSKVERYLPLVSLGLLNPYLWR
jgi:polysaccharide export outer membrane protein